MAHYHMTEFSNDYSSLRQDELEFLEKKLIEWKLQVENEMLESLHVVQKACLQDSDIVDRAESERERQMQLTRMEMNKSLLIQINDALTRIKNGTYGYCEESGFPISFARLQAWPIARRSLVTVQHRTN